MAVVNDAARKAEPAASVRRTGPRRRLFTWLVLIPGTIYAGMCGLLAALQTRMIFPGPPPTLAHAPMLPAGAERLTLKSRDGSAFDAIYFPAPGASPAAPAPCVIFFHGNAESIENQVDLPREYNARGWSLLIPEYRGYGTTPGTPSQDGIVSDMVDAFDAIKARPGVDPARIVLHGRSLGGGVAFQVAARRPPAALIVQSTFTSVSSFAGRFFMPEALVRHPFRSDEVAPTLACPVLVLHGSDDQTVPVSHGRSLAALCPRSTYVELPGGHNDFPRDEGAYWEAIGKFLAGV